MSFRYRKTCVFQVKLFSIPSKSDHARKKSPLPARAGYGGPEGASNLTQQSFDPEAMSKGGESRLRHTVAAV